MELIAYTIVCNGKQEISIEKNEKIVLFFLL